MRALVVVAIVAAHPAVADPCAHCADGDALIDKLSLQPLRAIARELTAPLADPVTPPEFARLVELRAKYPVLVRAGALADDDLGAVAAALCKADTGACVDATRRTLHCLADRCEIDLPPGPRVDATDTLANCHTYNTHKRSPSYGLGFDWGTGWQASRYPTDGRAWSLGMEGRLRLGHAIGLAARVDRINSVDGKVDTDGNGHDDMDTGPITRLSTLVGPTIVFDLARYKSTTRFLRVDFLGGYISTRSQAGESGPAAAIDVAYQLSVFRFGARFEQGFLDARDASMLLAHFGIVTGATPTYRNARDCGAEPDSRSTRLGIGLDLPIVGAGFDRALGFELSGVGVEAMWIASRHVDVLAHADLLLYPGQKNDVGLREHDRVIHQAVLAGLRASIPRRHHQQWFATVMTGYTEGAGLDAQSGPIADVAVAWGISERDGGFNVRLHYRFGLAPDDIDYRTLFLSAGFEFHLDRSRWRR
jgi:hypothetical protein